MEHMATIDYTDGDLIELAPGVLSPSQMTVTTDVADGYTYAVALTVRPIAGKLEVVDMAVAQLEGGAPVTRGGIAGLAIGSIMSDCVHHLRLDDGNGDLVPLVSAVSREDIDRLKVGNPGDEELRILGRLFRIRRAFSDKPTNELAADVGVTTATMKRWLARAVEAGYLTDRERERSKAGIGSTRTNQQVRAFLAAYRRATSIDLPRSSRPAG